MQFGATITKKDATVTCYVHYKINQIYSTGKLNNIIKW